MTKNEIELLGGIGEKKSNRGTQHYYQDRVYDSKSISANVNATVNPYYAVRNGKDKSNMRIRKLTPKECMTLMGFEKQDEEEMREIGLGDSGIYHCAGDSIVVSCLIGLLGQLLPITEDELKKKINNYVNSIIGKGEISGQE